MNELNAGTIERLKGSGFGGKEYLTIGEFSKIIFREGYEATILEKKEERLDFDVPARRIVIGVSYAADNTPVYLHGHNYIAHEGIYYSKDAIREYFEDYAGKPHTWAAGEPMNSRNDLVNDALSNRVHNISGIVLIIKDSDVDGKGYIRLPDIETYRIKCADGYEAKGRVGLSNDGG